MNRPASPTPARPPRRLPAWLRAALRGLLGLLVVLPMAGGLYQLVASRIDARNVPPRDDLIDVGGYRLYLHCIGQNTDQRPTVILETGLGGGATSADWAWVQPQIARTTRVCAYDRAGLGWSDPGPQPRDAQHIAAELHALLQASRTPGPYVLVGWSYGGLYMRLFASRYRAETAGLVLVDSSSPEQCDAGPEWQAQCASTARTYSVSRLLAPLGVARLIGLSLPASGLPAPQAAERLAAFSATRDWDALRREFLASAATNAEVLHAQPLGDIPLFVVTATDHGASPALERSWQAWQAAYTSLSTNSAQRIVQGATHESLVHSPTGSQPTLDAILQVVQAAHARTRLKP